MKSFNIAGPCRPDRHYMLPATPRLPGARELIDEGAYFVVHAPRQSGKTTSLQALAAELLAEGEYAVVYISCESAAAKTDKSAPAEDGLLAAMTDAAEVAGLPEDCLPPPAWPDGPVGRRLFRGLAAWARSCSRPLVLLLDEIDSLRGEELVSVLRQIREGYNSFNLLFPRSVILCGMRNVRDYKAASGGDPNRLGTASPFNIVTKTMRLADFTLEEMCELYGQHTAETGQEFTAYAIQRAFHASQGQPWLVNALAREVVLEMRVPVDQPITDEHMDQAVERLIVARATHLDSLVTRLEEPRIRQIIEPVIAGGLAGSDVSYNDDLSYARDLGLVARTNPVQIANPIYQEVVLRVLAQRAESQIEIDRTTFLTGDGRLDMGRVLSGFAEFWRQNGEVLQSRETYHEAACHLIFMAWLHRVVNGGGAIDREYALGRGRMDICVRWPYAGPDGERLWQWEGMEIKVHHPKQADPVQDGLVQLDRYLDHLDLDRGTLIVFDRRPSAPPLVDRTRIDEATSPGGRTITLVHA